MVQYNVHALFISEYPAHHKILFGLTRVLYFTIFVIEAERNLAFLLIFRNIPEMTLFISDSPETGRLHYIRERWLLVLGILFILLEDSDSSCSLQMNVCVLFHLCSIKYHLK